MFINPSFSTIPPYTGQCLHLEEDVIILYDKMNWIIKTYKLKLLKLLKLLKRFLYITIVSSELLLSPVPPRLLRSPCHYSRGISIRWTVDTSIFELLNNCSRLEAMFLPAACDVAVSYFVDCFSVFLRMSVV
jgi:hypothetical protein